jgi:hypothetical protein
MTKSRRLIQVRYVEWIGEIRNKNKLLIRKPGGGEHLGIQAYMKGQH